MTYLGDGTVRQQVIHRIRTLQPDSRARWGRMTAPQMVCHLTDSFRVPMGEKSASPASNVFQRTFVKWLALYLPAPWPKGVPTRPEVEQGAGGGGTPPREFESDRAELLDVLERFSNADRRFRWSPHPIFGDMTDWEWLRWGYLHTDHHLRQFGV